MHKKIKIILSIVSLLSIGAIILPTTISCSSNNTDSSNSTNSTENSTDLSNSQIANNLTSYFNESSVQNELITLALNEGLTYNNGLWNLDNNTWSNVFNTSINKYIQDCIGNINDSSSSNFAGIPDLELSNGNLVLDNFSYENNTASFLISWNSSKSSTICTIQLPTNFIPYPLNELTNYLNTTSYQNTYISYLVNNGYIYYNDWNSNDVSANALLTGLQNYLSNLSNNSNSTTGFWNNALVDLNSLSIDNFNNDSPYFSFNLAINGISSTTLTVNLNLSNYITSQSNINEIQTTIAGSTGDEVNFVQYLLNKGYITNTNNEWNYETDFENWNNALTSGLKSYLNTINQNIADSLTMSELSITSFTLNTYDNNNFCSFNLNYNGISIPISFSLNQIFSNAKAVANNLNKYFSNTTNQLSLLKYLVNNNYITYSNNWTNGASYSSLSNAFSDGLISYLQYDEKNILNTNGITNINNISIANFSNINNTWTFTFAYANLMSSNSVIINSKIFAQFNQQLEEIANTLTTYFTNNKNNENLIDKLISNGTLTFSNNNWFSNISTSSLLYTIQSLAEGSENEEGINIGDLTTTKTTLSFQIHYYGFKSTSTITINESNVNTYVTSCLDLLDQYFDKSTNLNNLLDSLIGNNYLVYDSSGFSYGAGPYYGVNSYTSFSQAISAGLTNYLSSIDITSLSNIASATNAVYVNSTSTTLSFYLTYAGYYGNKVIFTFNANS